VKDRLEEETKKLLTHRLSAGTERAREREFQIQRRRVHKIIQWTAGVKRAGALCRGDVECNRMDGGMTADAKEEKHESERQE